MFSEGKLDDAANIAAINVYIMSQPLNTPEAAKIRDEWVKWHDGLGWFDTNLPSDRAVYDKARDIRNRFNLANAKTAAEKAAVKEVQKTGLSSEELRGETDRRLSDGNYALPPPESEPWLPTKTKVAIGVGAAVLLGLTFLKRMYVDPFLPKGK